MLSFNMVTPLIARYVMELGGTASIAGVIAGMFSFFAFAFRPFVGYMTDRVDKKIFMVVGLCCGIFAMLGYCFSATIFMVGIFRVLHALALSIQTTIITVMAMNYMPSDRIAEGVGYIGIAAMLGMSIGPGIGVAVADCISAQLAFFYGSVVMCASLFLALLLPKTPLSKTKSPAEKGFSFERLFSLSALPLAIFAMSFAFCAGLTSGFIVLLGSSRGISHVALFFFVSSLGMVFVRPLAGRYTDHHGIKKIGFISFVAECVAMLVIACANSLTAIIVGAVFRIFGQGMAQSSIQGQVLKDSPEDVRGVASSTFYLGIDAGQGLGAMVGGLLIDIGGYALAFLSGPVMLVLGLFIWMRGRRVMGR